MKLTVVGCSPAWPNPSGAQSGYLVEVDGHSLLLDCGPGVLGRLRHAHPWPEPDAIVITHFHLDHWGDLVPWVSGGAFHGQRTTPHRPELWLPPGGVAQLERFAGLFGAPGMFERAFAPREYRPGVAFIAGGCELTATAVPHYRMDAYALRVAGGDRMLAYSGDSGPDEALASVARDADLFVCEATLLSGELDGELRGHLSLEEALAAFDASGGKELLLTHRPCELEAPDELAFAYDGLVLDV